MSLLPSLSHWHLLIWLLNVWAQATEALHQQTSNAQMATCKPSEIPQAHWHWEKNETSSCGQWKVIFTWNFLSRNILKFWRSAPAGETALLRKWDCSTAWKRSICLAGLGWCPQRSLGRSNRCTIVADDEHKLSKEVVSMHHFHWSNLEWDTFLFSLLSFMESPKSLQGWSVCRLALLNLARPVGEPLWAASALHHYPLKQHVGIYLETNDANDNSRYMIRATWSRCA